VNAKSSGKPGREDEPPTSPDLNDSAIRADLAPAAMTAMIRLADKWGLDDHEMRHLLGGISQTCWEQWKVSPPRELTIDQFARISNLLDIYASLHKLFRKPLADEWVKRPNSNALYGGAPPLDLMLGGQISDLTMVRAHLYEA